ncbi:slipin family protein [archaeon]|nr:slipin family protein [archaeon]
MVGIIELFIVGFLVLSVAGSAVKVAREYERCVIFRLGRLIGTKGPGIFILIPGIDKMVKVDLRTVTLDVPTQEVITKDNVPAQVNAVVYFKIVDAENAINQVEDYFAATSLISQTSLRSILGQSELDELLSERDKINTKLQSVIDSQTDPWGIKVSTVEVKDVELPENMKRAMAKQAEAERERRAKIINAEGEFQAAQKLQEAAHIISKEPAALQLRFLQTVNEATSEKASTIILPVPIDLIEQFFKKKKE